MASWVVARVVTKGHVPVKSTLLDARDCTMCKTSVVFPDCAANQSWFRFFLKGFDGIFFLPTLRIGLRSL